MSEILVGTSGYSYNDWRGIFYPRNMQPQYFLSFYSREFNAVELNFSYYRMPNPHQFVQMLKKSNYRLEFVVKAFRELTHEITEKSIPETLPLFKDALAPLVENGKLGAVLLQFPQSFHYTKTSRIYLEKLIEGLRPLPLCVEFRQREWLKNSVYNTLSRMNTGFVCVDQPRLKDLLPPLSIVTSDLAYIRFHGRNRANWYKGNSSERYDYLYAEEELMEWVPGVQKLAEKTKKIFILFNNHIKGQAVNNARMMINLLG